MRLTSLYRWFAARAGKKAVGLFLLLFVLMNVILKFLSDKILANSDGKAKIIDLEFGYTPQDFYTWLDLYGESGREIYFYIAIGVDVVYPIIYTTALIFFLVTILESAFPRLVNSLYKFTFVPVLIFVADVVENSCNAIAVKAYPVQMPALVQTASVFTQIKWLLLLLVIAALLMGLVGYLIYRDEAKGQQHTYRNPEED
jgi:hypothetical protein